MKGKLALRMIASFIRFLAVLLITIAMSLTLLLIAQQVFTPFQVVVSDSMAPQIMTGDAVILKDLEPSEIEVGQVIIFRNPDEKSEFIIHRVIAIEDAGTVLFFSTKGDNNPEPDPGKIPTGQVVGGVAVKLPRLGSFLEFLSSTRGYLSCIAIPAAMSLILVFVVAIFEKLFHIQHRRRDDFLPGATAQ